MQDFRRLLGWQKAHKLTLEVCAFAATLRHPGEYCLRDQIVRAAISVPANIAEGCGRMATGSCAGSPEWPWARRANLSIIFFSLGT
jgi:hypothetical protein